MVDPTRLAIANFFKSQRVAVVGASTDPRKFGNKLLRALAGKFGPANTIPVNPEHTEVEGLKVQPLKKVLASNSADTLSIAIATSPPVSVQIVKEAITAGHKRIWLHPGAESPEAVNFAEQKGVKIISCGPDILVELGEYRDDF